MHLDARVEEELLAGTLPREEARLLARHLAGGCDLCEAFIARAEEADAVDGRVDRALAATARDRAGDDTAAAEGFADVERRLREDASRPRRCPARWAGAAAAALLAAGLVVVVVARLEGPAWDGTKGTEAVAGPVRLRFVVVTGSRGGEEVRRGTSGEPVDAGARLGFEVELPRSAHVALARVGEGDGPEVFWRGELPPGASVVAIGDAPAGYALAGLSGRQRFVAIASAAALDDRAIARALAPPSVPGPGEAADVATAAVEVQVE
jgi:hypothetical protein